MLKNVRNFSIIAHIDHGKSTLADRLLEFTGTIEKRKMREQVLDSMELERERGITIKMQPVRMNYSEGGIAYELNLIDTPGHIDFSYEVSRALTAVEGSLLLVDATQGVQAQTLTTLGMAREQGLAIIPVLSKIDSPLARSAEVKEEIVQLLGCSPEDIVETSGKTGEGVDTLLSEIIRRIPPPRVVDAVSPKALVFDFQYSNHQGIILYVRNYEGSLKKGDALELKVAKERFLALEVGTFMPEPKALASLEAGEIGYVVTGIKRPGIASVGDTVVRERSATEALEGYMNPRPVVWASVYPEGQDDFAALRQALDRLRLSDASLSFEEEHSGSLGRGFRCGFLGMLHLEIITERLRREFDLNLIITTPSITYEVELKDGKRQKIYTPSLFPDHGSFLSVYEPWVRMRLITPTEYLGNIMQLLFPHEGVVQDTITFGDNRTELVVEMPLRELMRNFFDEVKSASSGFASLSYELADLRPAHVTRLDILVAEEIVPAFSRVVAVSRVQEEAEAAVEKLHKILPRQMFVTKIQGQALGRILSSRTLSAMQKDVTQHMYGGDITRKMKLREKQKKGKKKMRALGSVNIPQDVFLKMLRSEDK
ncbi:MAG TPA: translation elongation factor 4 [Candidatus Paceibacterota bacterium]|nr:translation elongation factor 4 [Candidatus Paceibacterota bacterium]